MPQNAHQGHNSSVCNMWKDEERQIIYMQHLSCFCNASEGNLGGHLTRSVMLRKAAPSSSSLL